MQTRIAVKFVLLIGIPVVASAAAPPIELEIVTERGVQITAPHEWLQLLAAIGIEHVRIRGGQPGDEPKIVNGGNLKTGAYHVVGVLTARDQLRLPGGTFSRSDRTKLKDYLARLGADGADAVTAPRVRFGLTEKELNAVLADLAQSIDFETKGLLVRTVIDRLQSKRAFKFAIDAETDQLIRTATPVIDELKGVATGTSLAIMLRNCDVALWPEKQLGQPIVYRMVPASADTVSRSTLGKMSATDVPYWPIGWQPEKSPGETAPSLMESLNAEIDGYTLEEALAAIGPRLKLPMYLDHAVLKAHHINPAKIHVKLARTRTSYKRVIDRILAQARLGSEIRVDESGMPFLWITQ